MQPSLMLARAATQLASPCRRRLTTSPSGAVRVANPPRSLRRGNRDARLTCAPVLAAANQPQHAADAPSSFAGLVEEKIIPAEDANLLPF
jgi:hypothetical protein